MRDGSRGSGPSPEQTDAATTQWMAQQRVMEEQERSTGVLANQASGARVRSAIMAAAPGAIRGYSATPLARPSQQTQHRHQHFEAQQRLDALGRDDVLDLEEDEAVLNGTSFADEATSSFAPAPSRLTRSGPVLPHGAARQVAAAQHHPCHSADRYQRPATSAESKMVEFNGPDESSALARSMRPRGSGPTAQLAACSQQRMIRQASPQTQQASAAANTGSRYGYEELYDSGDGDDHVDHAANEQSVVGSKCFPCPCWCCRPCCPPKSDAAPAAEASQARQERLPVPEGAFRDPATGQWYVMAQPFPNDTGRADQPPTQPSQWAQQRTPQHQQATAPAPIVVDATALGRVVAQEVARGMAAKVNDVPKALRTVTDPNHNFEWATQPLDNSMLRDYSACISAERQRQVCPVNTAALEQATDAASEDNLLTPLVRMTASSGVISPVDYTQVHREILERLVAAVCLIPDWRKANAEAGRILLSALRTALTSNNPRLHTAWASLASYNSPPTPLPILIALADAHLPPESFGTRRYEYHRYLALKYDMSDRSSIPSQVLAGAIRAAREHLPSTADVMQVNNEAKLLFGDWIRQMMETQYGHMIKPLHHLISNMDFTAKSATDWQKQLRVYEQPDNVLHALVQSLPPIVVGPHPARPPARPAARPREARPTPAQVNAAVMDRLAESVPAQVNAAMGMFFGADGADSADGSPEPGPHNVHSPHIYTFVRGSDARDPACAPLTDAQKAATLDPASPFYLKALGMPTTKMDDAWVQLYGCPGFPAPNCPSSDRQYLNIVGLAKALSIEVPAKFLNEGKGEPHVGGDSCFACMFIAHLEGLLYKWYLHPADRASPPGAAPKPFGKQHKYVHQVFKCALALALAHRLVRTDRDAGRGDINRHLFGSGSTDAA